MQNEICDQLTAIVVTYNSINCIDALASGLKTLRHVIVVDNASTDGTPEKIFQLLPQAKIILNSKNEGFGTANNRALKILSTPFALLINPDCIPTETFFYELIKRTESFPEAGIFVPHIIDSRGRIQLNYRLSDKRYGLSGTEASGPCCVKFASGAVMLLNIAMMEDTGFFDERFFLYYEDDDLCMKTSLLGKSIILFPDIKIVHLSRRSSIGKQTLKSEFLRGYHHAQSKIIYEHKYAGKNKAKILKTKALIYSLGLILVRFLFPQPKYVARSLGRLAGFLIINPSKIQSD